MLKEDDLLDVQYVAARLQVNPRTIMRMVERKELPAIKVARRLRFRRSDLERYLQTHLSTSTPSLAAEPGKQPIFESPDFEQEEEAEAQDEDEVPAQADAAMESPLREAALSSRVQGTRLRKQAAQLEIEEKLLEIERKKLDLQKQRIDLHTHHIDYSIDLATRMVEKLHPHEDEKTKAESFHSLLSDLLQLGEKNSVALSLPPSKADKKEAVPSSNASR